MGKILIKVKKIIQFLKGSFRFGSFGFKSIIFKPLNLKNPRFIFLGKCVTILKNARIECYTNYAKVDLSPKLIIEDNVTIEYNFTALVASNIIIKKNSLIASNVFISSENHGMDPTKGFYGSQPLIVKDVVIGQNCWIGEKVIILPGVHIGDNAIIGAGSVVTKDISANSVAVGNPAKVIKIIDSKLN